MLKIWGRRDSLNVQKVLWICEELGLAYERKDVGGSYGGLDEPAYRALNPNGLIPTMQDGDLVLWESNAIVRYLGQRDGDGKVFAADKKLWAQSDQWMDWQQSTLWPPIRTLFIQFIRKAEGERDPALIEAALEAGGKAVVILDRALEGNDYLTGSKLTVGDIASGVVIHRWYQLPVPHGETPFVRAWYQRLCARPAFQSALAPQDRPKDAA